MMMSPAAAAASELLLLLLLLLGKCGESLKCRLPARSPVIFMKNIFCCCCMKCDDKTRRRNHCVDLQNGADDSRLWAPV